MEYNIGDIVEATTIIDNKIQKGLKGRILSIEGGWIGGCWFKVEWSQFINGHNSDGLGKNGYCWNVYLDKIKKINKQLEFDF
jgi:hypothetical protein